MARAFKKQTELVRFAAGTPGGARTTTVHLDSAYRKVTGLRIHEFSGGGLSFFEIGLEDSSGTLVDTESSEVYHYAPEKPWEPVDLSNHGQQLKVKTVLPSQPSGEVVYQIVFLLER
ncbi:hypothetical protein AAG747_07865 [Rapidithrix thailandica]|uniref:Uncharacterized protein n=1 Tax=Rapidithrix thailandica TaxID=413964 RepID=A0AAW9S7V9_9BACT